MRGGYDDDHLKALRSIDLPPEPSPSFLEVPPFGARWTRLRLTDADLHVLQNMILANPSAGVVVPGTNGLRKLRFAPPGSGRGKSGSYRVLYLNAPAHGLVALWAVLDKTESANFTKAQREILAARAAAFLAALDSRSRR